jgi:hypothetical protein
MPSLGQGVRYALPLALLLVAAAGMAGAQQPASPEPAERIGRMDGPGVVLRAGVAGLVPVAAGAPLESGSVVGVADEYARIVLDEGGEIAVCGPARFSLLKSGGALTLALDYGRVRPRMPAGLDLNVLSPFVVATPIAIGEGPRDVVVGIEVGGEMCVAAERGALRLENQFSGETLVIPQSGEFALLDGRLAPVRAGAAPCRCEAPMVREPVLLAQREPPEPEAEPAANPAPAPLRESPPARPAAGASLRPPADSAARSSAASREPPAAPAVEPAQWRAEMPPLVFDAAAPEPLPPPEPEYALLIREARATSGLVFRGEVESGRASAAVSRRGESRPARVRAESGEDSGNAFRKVGRFFKRIFGGGSSG